MAQKETISSFTQGDFAKELSISDGKMPPNAVDFERLIIGTFLIDKKGLDYSIDLLKPEVFYDPRHQVIFETIFKLYETNLPVDLMTVIQELKKDGKLQQAGGDHYIIELTLGVSSSAHIEYHTRVVLQKYILRSLINVSANVIDNCYKESSDVFELLDKTEQAFFEITNGTIKKGFDTANQLVKQAIETIKSLKDREGLSGVPSGFTAVDKETGGWQNSDLIIIAARPAMGKTAFLLSMARNIAVQHKIPMALFSLEMASVQLITRMIASETGISSEKLRKGTLNDDEWSRLFNNVSELENAPLYIDETPSLSIFDFRAKCRRLVMQHGVKIIMVDYLQLMTANQGKGGGNREQEIAMISRSLKAIAKELNVPVIALSQLSRTVETRPGKRPQLSDLRESGAIEQDADIVSFIFRPEYYKIGVWDNDEEGMETSTENQAELIIAKHRNGATADVRLSFFKNIAKFADLDLYADAYGNSVYQSSNFGQQDNIGGFEKVNITADPSAAFGVPSGTDFNGLSGSSLNDMSDEDLPF